VPLEMRQQAECINIFDDRGNPVARLSKKAETIWLPRLGSIRAVRVLAIVHRSAEQESDTFRDRCKMSEWEFPMIEISYEGALITND
ncbi:MAG: hypothetical protein ABIR24_03905, partial [Verrucomicrobiota bacterium]